MDEVATRETENVERPWVIVGDGNLSMMYLGRLAADDYLDLEYRMKTGQPLHLVECRIFFYQVLNLMTDKGQVMQTQTQVLPFPLTLDGGEVAVVARTVVEVAKVPGMSVVVEQMLDNCRQSELKLKAKASGLTVLTPT